MLYNILNKIHHGIHWLLPLQCAWCGLAAESSISLCNDCQHKLAKPSVYCKCCALPYCLNTKNYFSTIIAPFHYTDPIDRFITLLKFHGQLFLAELLGTLLAQVLSNTLTNATSIPELIIPVPLHKQRYQQRGFNQALEIAKPIAKKLNIPIDVNIITRNKNTQPQSALNATSRQTNIKNAFILTKKIPGKHIVLVDDVVTTGNTVNEVSKVLLQSGIERVDVWTCTRVVIGVNT